MSPIGIGCRVAALSVCLAGGVAMARDLPKHQAEEPKRPTGCESLGAGYVKAPGSDTCVRLGGSVRVEGSIIRR